jgi:hypothetical protein
VKTANWRGDNNNLTVNELVDCLVANPRDPEAAHSLLRLLHSGTDATPLLRLIRAASPDVIEIGCWLYSELGILAESSINELVALLPYAPRSIVFYVLDCLTSCVGSAKIEGVMAGLDQLKSSDENIVWKAQRFLWSLPDPIVDQQIEFAKKHAPFRDHIPGLELFKQTLLKAAPTAIKSALESSDRLLRAYAVVCAVAISGQHQSPALFALTSGDKIVREYAESAIRLGDLKFQ